MAENIQGLSALLRRVNQLATDTRHVEAPLKAAGAVMLASVEQNFRAQGRPAPWRQRAGGGATGAAGTPKARGDAGGSCSLTRRDSRTP